MSAMGVETTIKKIIGDNPGKERILGVAPSEKDFLLRISGLTISPNWAFLLI